MFKFYRDITFYAVLFSVVTIPLGDLYSAAVIFGVLGTPVGVGVFNYFQKHEFYGYYNRGYTKTFLIRRTWLVNLLLTPVMLGVVFLILKLITLGAPARF